MRNTQRTEFGDLLQVSSRAVPTLTGHPDWIERLESVLRVIAGPADQRRYRLDGLHCVTNDYLHCRVAAVLRHFDRLIEANVHLPQGSDGEMRPTLRGQQVIRPFDTPITR